MSEIQNGPSQLGWRYVFFGRVGPPHSFLTMPRPFSVDMKHRDAPLAGRLTVTIERMQVIAVVEAQQEFDDLYTLRNVVQDMAAILTDCANLSSGQVFEVQLVSVHDVRRGRSIVFDPGAGALAQSSPGEPIDISELVHLAWSEPSFRRALADFRSAIRYPGQTGFHCGRAIEALAHHFGPMNNTANIKATRAKLRTALAISKEMDSKFIRAAADPRHGGGPWLTDAERGELMRAVREVMFRFAQMVKARRAGQASN